jgi:hypothetical protein
MRSFPLCLAAILALLFALNANAEQLVREFSGSRSTETAEFEVKAPWLVDWRVNSDFPSSMGIAVSLTRGGTDAYEGKVFKTKSPGNGLRLMEESGRFRFKIDASITHWTLKVIQLSPDEVEQYQPKKVLDY